MIERALNRAASSRPAGSPPLCATIETSAPCESCRSVRRGGGCPRASSRTVNSRSSTSLTTVADDTAGPDQAAAHGRLVLFCELHRRDSHRRSPGHYVWAAVLIGLVLVECGVLAANRGRCPLTGLAARHTEQRSANFDIYLPLWLARYNKTIFGALFVAGTWFVLARWWSH